MLDIIAPVDKIGYVQGLNNSAMNFGMALAPWLFGLLADATTTDTAIWTGIGISWLAAVINTPLMWRKAFGPAKKPVPKDKRPLAGENTDLIGEALGMSIQSGKGMHYTPTHSFVISSNKMLKTEN